MTPFDPHAHFTKNTRCRECSYRAGGRCAADSPTQCPAAADAAYAYLTRYIPAAQLDQLLKHSAGDDLLAAKLADAAGLGLAAGCRLLDAFLFWTSTPQ